jgi:hypothetical protein
VHDFNHLVSSREVYCEQYTPTQTPPSHPTPNHQSAETGTDTVTDIAPEGKATRRTACIASVTELFTVLPRGRTVLRKILGKTQGCWQNARVSVPWQNGQRLCHKTIGGGHLRSPTVLHVLVRGMTDDRSERVFIAYSKPQAVVLFAQGLDESDFVSFVCSLGNAEVLSYEKYNIYADCCVVMITCKRDGRWKLNELILFQMDPQAVSRPPRFCIQTGWKIRPEPSITRARSPCSKTRPGS